MILYIFLKLAYYISTLWEDLCAFHFLHIVWVIIWVKLEKEQEVYMMFIYSSCFLYFLFIMCLCIFPAKPGYN